MIEYLVASDEEGNVDGCECCQCEVPTHLFEKPQHLLSEAGLQRKVSEPVSRGDQHRFCEVCSSTFISLAYSYRHHEPTERFMLQCLAQCTNMILGAIRAQDIVVEK